MDVKTILENFHREKNIRQDVIDAIESDRELRVEFVNYFRNNNDREFVLHLLDKMTSIRKADANKLSGDSLMFACYILGFHNQVDDCIKIWDAKATDFDTYCYIDIQLVPFAGVEETISFLKQQNTDKAKKVLEHIEACHKAGDFDNLDEYYSKDNLPWWV